MEFGEWLTKNNINSTGFQNLPVSNQVKALSLFDLEHSKVVQTRITEMQIAISGKAEMLRLQVSSNDFQIERQVIALQRERDELERVKASFRLYLDNQRQEMEMKREGFENEQQRQNQRLDNEFYVTKSTLDLQAQQMEYTFLIEMQKIELQKEQQRQERLKLETERIEKTLSSLLTSYTFSNEAKQAERIREMETMYKEFEMQIALIRLLTAEQQAQEFEKLKEKIQQRMNGFFSESGAGFGGVNQEF